MIAHPPLRQRIRARMCVENAIRDWFAGQGLLELATRSLVDNPGFEPHLRAFRVPFVEAGPPAFRWLHTSPEYAIKATLAEIGHDVFTLARVYRDEPAGPLHSAEFTMLEWYRLDADLDRLMHDCEALIGRATGAIEDAVAAGRIDRAPGYTPPPSFAPPFVRIRCQDAFARYAGINLEDDAPDAMRAALRARAVDCRDDWDRGTLFGLAQALLVEPALAGHGPCFLTDFPADQAALARLCDDDPRWAHRFELYLPARDGSVELANAFLELTDAAEQRARFVADARYRTTHRLDTYPMPESMLAGLSHLPQTAGIALGVERLTQWCVASRLGWDVVVADLLVG